MSLKYEPASELLHRPSRHRAKREQLKGFNAFCLKGNSQDKALTVLFVPNFLGSGPEEPIGPCSCGRAVCREVGQLLKIIDMLVYVDVSVPAPSTLTYFIMFVANFYA